MKKIIKKLGPGLLYAGAAIGVSHLVQSTRAGAEYSFSLIIFIILANVIKYPFFKIGAIYPLITNNKTLIDGYKSIGKWAINILVVQSLLTMIIVIAAISMVTSSIIPHLLNIDIGINLASALLLLLVTLLLIKSNFTWLNKIIKWLIITLSILTICSSIYLMFNSKIISEINVFSFSSKKDILFLIALIGWMPAPMDISIWQSIWVKESNKKEKKLTDFRIGYWTTTVLAISFLILGAKTMFGTTINTNSAISFTFSFINMYTSIIGNYAFPIIALIAFITMFSTTITVMDAYPKVIIESSTKYLKKINYHTKYNISIIVTAILSWLTINFFINSFGLLIDFVTTISFILTPLLAILNLISLKKINNIPKNLWSNYEFKIAYIFIIIIILFTLYYLITIL